MIFGRKFQRREGRTLSDLLRDDLIHSCVEQNRAPMGREGATQEGSAAGRVSVGSKIAQARNDVHIVPEGLERF